MDLASWSSASWESIIGDKLDTNLDTGIASIRVPPFGPFDTFYQDRLIPGVPGVPMAWFCVVMSCHPFAHRKC